VTGEKKKKRNDANYQCLGRWATRAAGDFEGTGPKVNKKEMIFGNVSISMGRVITAEDAFYDEIERVHR